MRLLLLALLALASTPALAGNPDVSGQSPDARYVVSGQSPDARYVVSGQRPDARSKELRLRLSTDPKSFDWNIAGPEITRVVVGNIMEGLFDFDEKLSVKPMLAKSFQLSDDRRTYTFNLRGDVKWTDGKALTAQDFVDSWQRLLDPLDRKTFANYLFSVEGAEDYYKGRTKDFSKVAIRAIGLGTIEVRLKSPLYYFPQLLALPVLYPIRKDVIARHGLKWAEPGNIVVLGPFVPVLHEKGKRVVLKRNQAYYGKAPQLESVILHVMNENTPAVELFNKGELDFVTPINLADLEKVQNSGAYVNSRQFRTRYLFFNMAKYPLTFPNVRKAIAMSIDRSTLSKALFEQRPPAESMVPAQLFPEGSDVKLAFDVAEAKKLLKASGIAAPAAVKLELMALSTDENALAVNNVAEQISANLRIKVEPKLLDRDQFISQVGFKSGDIYYFARGADYPDVDAYMQTFLSDAGVNMMNWKNAKYDELVKKAAHLPLGAERAKTYKDALRILIQQEAAIAPLHLENFSYLLNPKVKNFVISPIALINLRNVIIIP